MKALAYAAVNLVLLAACTTEAPSSGSDGGSPQQDAAVCVPSECPPTGTTCVTPQCTTTGCATANAAAGTLCTDSGGTVCNATGECVECLTPPDCPASTTVCVINTCTGSACGTMMAARGTACTESGGVVCDGNGACTAMHCTDNVRDADETDVDCGGGCGATCMHTAPQQLCNVAADCLSGVCGGAAPLHCQPPTCTDNVRNGTETDVDCGGTCGATCKDTGPQQRCQVGGDCLSGVCGAGQLCQPPTCSDSAENGAETDIDCGGAMCVSLGLTCAPTKGCLVDVDCTGAALCASGTHTAAATCDVGDVCVAGVQTACTQACDAQRGCVECNTTADCAPASCANHLEFVEAATCTAAQTCSPGAPTNCAASGMVCDAVAGCVECTENADCFDLDAGFGSCMNNQCL